MATSSYFRPRQVFFTITALVLVSVIMWGLLLLLQKTEYIPQDKDSPVFNFITVTIGIAVAVVGGVATIALAFSSLKISMEQSEIALWSVLTEELASMQDDILTAESHWNDIGARGYELAKINARYKSHVTRGSDEILDMDRDEVYDLFKAAIRTSLSPTLRAQLNSDSPNVQARAIDKISSGAFAEFRHTVLDPKKHHHQLAMDQVDAVQNLSDAVLRYFEFIDSGRRGNLFELLLEKNCLAEDYIKATSQLLMLTDREAAERYEKAARNKAPDMSIAAFFSAHKVLYSNYCFGPSLCKAATGSGSLQLLKHINYRGKDSIHEFYEMLPIIDTKERLNRILGSTDQANQIDVQRFPHVTLVSLLKLSDSEQKEAEKHFRDTNGSFAFVMMAIGRLIDTGGLQHVIKEHLLSVGASLDTAEKLSKRYSSTFKSEGIGSLKLEELTGDMEASFARFSPKMRMHVVPRIVADRAV